VKREIAEYLKEQILLNVGKQQSPIAGEKWPNLKKGPYRDKVKPDIAGNTRANMELRGDMLDQLDYEITDDGVEIGIYGSEAWKADGHNKLSGATNKTPKRRFIPKKGQNFDRGIQENIENIIKDYIIDQESFNKSDFDGVSSRASLLDIFRPRFEGMSDVDIISTVKRNTQLVDMLKTLGFLKFLV